ncbi:myotilin-like isoform X1 [Acipenser oxyrinchus oxyrinchus]|uniref:Myotilin-like isoform X1 n=1 Tax=Acipenser oxyrinchus oxyrinchus TaxID=40147 RepID=A0AAD8G242_ACIOX|nr:myotilin-like isoform X1 [Acipenser oxyrinchus oxyrinchus]
MLSYQGKNRTEVRVQRYTLISTDPVAGRSMAQVQKKTTSVSLTISSCMRESSSSFSSSSSVLQQRQSSLAQPLCINSQQTQSPSSSHNYAGNGGVTPAFVKCLHDISTVKGQLVVLECRIRGNPPLQVLWFREEEQILDSADFRILRKSACSLSQHCKEVCTLVITEAFPEDSGLFKCVAGNQYGTVSCSALLEVYSGVDEVLAEGELSQAEEDFSSFLCDPSGIPPPPEWPDSPEEESAPPLPPQSSTQGEFWDLQEHRASLSEAASSSAQSRVSSESCTLPPPPVEEEPPQHQASSSQPRKQQDPAGDMSTVNVPSYSPTIYPPCMFNYERPRHFIQSQPLFQAPSYESLQGKQGQQGQAPFPNGHEPSPSSSTLGSPVSTPSSPREQPPAPSHSTMRSSVTLMPKVSSNATPQSPAAFLRSILPSQPASAPQPKPVSLSQPKPASHPQPQPLLISKPQPPSTLCSQPSPSPPSISPSLPKSSPVQALSPAAFLGSVLPNQPPANPRGSLASDSFPRPLLKTPRPAPRSTDEQIQGSKDALIQDLERKLRCKEARRQNGSQKLTYEERMARRLLGPHNAASVFELDNSEDSHLEQQDSPDGRQTGTGKLWSRPGSRSEESETASIQEKCYAPRFFQVPQDLTVEEGRFCRIDFKVGGLPTPDVVWYLNGKPIRPDDFHKMLVCEKGVHSFIIEVVTVDHAGVYECVARNRAGENRFTLQLDVIAQERRQAPVFTQKMQNCQAVEGDTVRLECQVSAAPPPELYWKKDNEMLHVDPERISVYQDNTGRLCLLIERVEKADAGWYTVSAINDAGMSTCNARVDIGTRMNKSTPSGRHLKVRPTFSQYSVLNGQRADNRRSLSPASPVQTAPLYESDEL